MRLKKMNFIYLSIVFSMCIYCANSQQKIAPGVPPQHYQQQQQQYQQPYQQQYGQPQYQQQVPVQQQVPIQQQQQQPQVPVQQQMPMQQQVPVQHQQVPAQHQVPVQHHQQGHHHGHGDRQILNAANVAQEAQHIAEHMDVPIDTSKMTDQELQFHYFKMHDADNNNKLDGCELIKSLIHWHEQGSKNVEEKIFKDEELVNLIDPILNVDDTNKDGYIDYPEFIRAQQKAAGQGKPQA